MGALVGGLIAALAIEQATKQLRRIADALEEKKDDV